MLRVKNTLGIDIGGTSIKAGFIPGGEARCLNFKSRPTPDNVRDFWHVLVNMIIDNASRYRVEKIGVGCPGPLAISTGTIIKSPHLPLKKFPLKHLLEKETGLPVFLDNDANAFTLAEAVWGAAKKYQNVIGLTLGTGLGGGIVLNKKIYHGRGNAGELGYTLINRSGVKGALGERGSAQEYMRAGRLLKQKTPPRSFWKNYGYNLGYTLASLSHILDPDIIIIGGQKAKAWPNFIKHLKAGFRKNCILDSLPIVKRSKLGDQAGVLGAALLTTTHN